MKKEIEYTFFYLDGDTNPYAYSDDKKLLKVFKETRRMSKFMTKRFWMDSDNLKLLSDDNPGGLLMNYKFQIGDEFITLPITINEKLNIEGYGNRAAMTDIYIAATKIPTSIFTDEVRRYLRLIDYQWANNYDASYVIPNVFCPDFFMIFLKYYGELMNLSKERSVRK